MPKQVIPPLSPEQLTKKLRVARKKIRELEGGLSFEREARAALEKRVKELESTQGNLMFHLRRAFKKLGMKPEQPKE